MQRVNPAVAVAIAIAGLALPGEGHYRLLPRKAWRPLSAPNTMMISFFFFWDDCCLAWNGQCSTTQPGASIVEVFFVFPFLLHHCLELGPSETVSHPN